MNPEKCPHCGAGMRKNWYTMTAGHANALIKIHSRVIQKGKNDVDIPKEVALTQVEYTVYQKLHMHGLIAKVRKDGVHRKGRYLVTRRGARFLRGAISIPNAVQSFRNRIVNHSETFVTIRDLLTATPYWGEWQNNRYEVAEYEDLIPYKNIHQGLGGVIQQILI